MPAVFVVVCCVALGGVRRGGGRRGRGNVAYVGEAGLVIWDSGKVECEGQGRDVDV